MTHILVLFSFEFSVFFYFYYAPTLWECSYHLLAWHQWRWSFCHFFDKSTVKSINSFSKSDTMLLCFYQKYDINFNVIDAMQSNDMTAPTELMYNKITKKHTENWKKHVIVVTNNVSHNNIFNFSNFFLGFFGIWMFS